MNDTKQAIQNAFIALYCKQPFDKMSVKALCAKAPIARTTFYEYYDNLGELKSEIETELIGGILEIAKSTVRDDIREENYAFLSAQPNMSYIAKWKNAIKYHFELCFPEKVSAPNYGLISEVIASAVIGAYTYWMDHPNEVDTQKLAGISVQMLAAAGRII